MISQRVLLARRVTSTAAAAAATTTPQPLASAIFTTTANTRTLHTTALARSSGWDKATPVGSLDETAADFAEAQKLSQPRQQDAEQQQQAGGGEDEEMSFDFGEEGGMLPAAPNAPDPISAAVASPMAAATSSSSASASAVHRMEQPGATLSASAVLRPAPPPKTVVRPDGTEEYTSEYMTTAPGDLVDMIRNYLQQRIDIPDVEHKLFTALLARPDEFTADQLLDVVERHFPPFTNERWGDRVKGMVRDRCMTEAAGMPPLSVARAIVLVGINGRSRRDVDFFKKMCKLLAMNINELKDPHTLCYVLVGLQNSRIRPPDSFLALVGRRFPILNKRNPLHALPAYRALTFYGRADYPLMNPYRYLADRIMAIIRDNLRLEGKGLQFDGLGRKVDPSVAAAASKARHQLLRGADGEEADDDVNELSSEDLDILRGLQREGQGSGGGAAAAPQQTQDGFSHMMAGQKQQQPPSFGGWGQAAAGSSSAPAAEEAAPSATPTPDAAAAEEEEAAAGSSSNNNNPIEESLRSSDVLPQSLKTATATTTAETPAAEADGEAVEDNKEQPEKKKRNNSSNLHHYKTPDSIVAHFTRTTGGLSPVQFVRFLFILALRRAPRQQYLRPIATDLLVPVVPLLSPPTFMRLVISMRMFLSEDKQLISAVLDRMLNEGPARVCLRNVFELLRLFGNQSTPIDVSRPHLLRFVQLCKAAFEDESKLRAKDMLAITGEFRNIYNKLKEDDAVRGGGASFGAVGNFSSGPDEWMDAVKETKAAGEGEEEGAEATTTSDEKKAVEAAEEEEQEDKPLTEAEKQHQQAISAVEGMFQIVERFALRMTNLMGLGVLALTNAETLLEICRLLPVSQTTAVALNQLKEARRRIDEEEGGPDAYAELLDIDVREIFFRLQVINNYDTFRSFRPLPATMIQDFKGLLDAMRADYILEAVHVYEQAFPGTLAVPVKRVLARHILEKMSLELRVLRGGAIPKDPEPSKLTASGKIIEVEKAKAEAAAQAAKEQQAMREQQFGFGAAAGRYPIRYVDDAVAAGVPRKFYQPYDCTNPRFQLMLFNAQKFNKFVNMLNATPLKRVRNSQVTWEYVEHKAAKVGALMSSAQEHSNSMEEQQQIVAENVARILKERRTTIETSSLEQSEAMIRGDAKAAVAEV